MIKEAIKESLGGAALAHRKVRERGSWRQVQGFGLRWATTVHQRSQLLLAGPLYTALCVSNSRNQSFPLPSRMALLVATRHCIMYALLLF